jgi:hypothetical protein
MSEPREWLKDMTLEMAEKVFQELRADAEMLAEVLAEYKNSEDWAQFISSGNIFDEVDGDFVMAFNKGEDAPWAIANQALADFRNRWPKEGE